MDKCFVIEEESREIEWKETAKNLSTYLGADEVHIAVNMKQFPFSKYYNCENLIHVLDDRALCGEFLNDNVKACVKSGQVIKNEETQESYYPLFQVDNKFLGIFYIKNAKKEMDSLFFPLLAMTIKYDMNRRRINETTKSVEEIRNNAISEVKKMSAMRDTFIATMSHELRTPLSGLIGANQILLHATDDSYMLKLIKVQQECASQLAELINDVLDFCKLRSTSVTLNEEPFNLSEVVQSCMSIYEVDCEKKGISLQCNIEQIEGTQFLGDARRVKQIILNLINNAVKYTSKGFIKVNVFIEDVVCIKVEDSGSGISKENLKYIFEPYFSAKQENWTQVRNGVGLGLAICYELVTLMEGTIGANSDGQTGTTITVTLPLKDANYQKLLVDNDVLLKGLNVLILEDRMEQRMYLLRILAQQGMKPHAFSNSTEALLFLDVMHNDVNIALVDIDLSESDKDDNGVIFAQAVRQRNYSMPLIALSSVGEHFGGEFLFNDIMVKPIHETDLFKKIRTCIENHKLIRSNSIEKYFVSHQKSCEASIRKNSSLTDMVLTEHQIRTKSMENKKLMNLGVSANLEVTRSKSVDVRKNSDEEKNLHFLIVDDDVTNANIFLEMLHQLGYINVHVVHSGTDCLQFLTENKVDILYLDIVMPKMSGYECTKRIRALPDRYGKNVRIVALTADALDSTRSRCLSQGFDYFLPKPITLEDLKNSITWMSKNKKKK